MQIGREGRGQPREVVQRYTDQLPSITSRVLNSSSPTLIIAEWRHRSNSVASLVVGKGVSRAFTKASFTHISRL
jgi:hypothetical protein